MTTTPHVNPGVTTLGDRYELVRQIGRGSSATVYEAIDRSLDRHVAVKVLHQQLSGDPAFLERFRAESRAVAALSHPNVMAVHDWGEGEQPYLVTELLHGGSLRAVLDSGAVLSPSQTIQIGLDACRGLNYAHGEGLVHRDITPANLLFGSDSRLRIADFGLAKAFAESGWTNQTGDHMVGTARYASPEQAKGKRLDAKSDVYSLGLILVEALSGSVPFSADTMLGTLTARVESDVPIPAAPEALRDVLRSMTQRNPEDRPSAHDAGLALVASAEGLARPKPLDLAGLVEPEPAQTRTAADPNATAIADVDATQIAPDHDNVERAVAEEPVRRWPWLLITTVAIGVAVWFGYQSFVNTAVGTALVPDVVGLTADEAVAEFGDQFVLDEKLERTADVEVGRVIETDPLSGTEVEEGSTVTYWVSLGRPLVRVPTNDLIGRSQEQAVVTLESLELSVGNIEEVFNEDVGAGNVIDVVTSSPELQTGESVDLIVSAGPQARVVPAFDSDTDAELYISTLEAAGVAVEQSRTFDAVVELDQFISVLPVPGTEVERGSIVTVVISDGPFPVPIPSSAGQPLGDVLDALDALDLLAGELRDPDGGVGNARCSVVGTDPPAGTELQPGSSVDVVLSDCGDGQ